MKYNYFLEHLEHREGNEECVYLDTLNKPTCGVGHLLTEKERQVYRVGDKVSQKQRNEWLKKDAAMAWEAAAQQMQDLRIEDTAFIIALGSVNFQSAYRALGNKDYDEAIRQVSTGSGRNGQSKWKEQTPVRVEDFVLAIDKLK